MNYKNGCVRKGEVFYNGKWHDSRLGPEMILADKIVDTTYKEILGFEATVTCIIGRSHSINSLHPKGGAEDFRTWTTPTSGVQIHYTKRRLLKNTLARRLGSDYDVVSHKTHIHIEYDPPRPTE